MASNYMDPTDPAISMLSNEMQAKNIPPQQAEAALASQGRQVPGQLAYLMLMNQRLKAAQPQQAPQTTVAQDLQMAMQGQGQVQQPQGPLPANQTAQFLAQQRAPQQMPQPNPMQQGIGQIPQRAVGQPTAYKGGGIVAFNEGGYTVTRDEVIKLLQDEMAKKYGAGSVGTMFQPVESLGGYTPTEQQIQQKMRELSAQKQRYSPGQIEKDRQRVAEERFRAAGVDVPSSFFDKPTPANTPTVTDKVAEEQAAAATPENPFAGLMAELNEIQINKSGASSTPASTSFRSLAGDAPKEEDVLARRERQRKAAGQEELDKAQKAEIARLTASMPEDKKKEMWANFAQAAFNSVGTPTRKRGLAGMLPGLGAAGAEFTKRQAASEKEYKNREALMKKAELELQKAQVAAKMGDYDAYNAAQENFKKIEMELGIKDVTEANTRERLQMELANRSEMNERDNAARAASEDAKAMLARGIKPEVALTVTQREVASLRKQKADADLLGDREAAAKLALQLYQQEQKLAALQALVSGMVPPSSSTPAAPAEGKLAPIESFHNR
jgi:hypothetical protein